MKKEENKRYPCPCCGYNTLIEKPPGTYDICPVCDWEDDDIQYNNPDFRGGANDMSLNEAKENYKNIGAKSLEHVMHVRCPLENEK